MQPTDTPPQGDLAGGGLRAVIRSVFVHRQSGVLEVDVDGGKRRLFFREGELHLPAGHPLAPQLAAGYRSGESGAAIKDVMSRMASVITGWRDGTFVFQTGAESVPDDAVGPLPTAELVMSVATLGRSDEDLLDALGGLGARLVSRLPDERLVRDVRLEGPDVQLLDELSVSPTLEGVLRSTSLRRREALERLCRLEALQLLESRTQEAEQETLVNSEVLRRFSERLVRQLAAEPVELDAATHRSRLAELLGRLGEVNHYQLLGVDQGAETDAIHIAYEELARLVHPLHASRLGLKGREEAMRLLFERATEAYLILTDPERRMRYNREMALATPPPVRGEQDEKLTREAARQYFLQARKMVQEEEYHYALELLRQAVQAHPEAEQYALMAEVQRQNPKWLHHAADSYRKALQLEPDNVGYRLALGELFERLDDPRRARAVYRSVLIRDPEQAQAREALDRVRQEEAEQRPGFFSRLFGGE